MLRPEHLVLSLAINLVWGYNLVAVKIGVTEFSPLAFTALRFAVLAAVLVPLLRLQRGQMPALFAIAMTMGALHFGLIFAGMALADDVSAVAIVIQLNVPFATILSVAFLGERIGWPRVAGLALAFAGVLVMSFDPRVFGYLDAVALTAAAALSGAIGMLLMRRIRDVGVIQLQGWLAVFSLPVLVVLAASFESQFAAQAAAASWRGWAAAIYTALAASLVGHGGLYYLLQRYPVSVVAPQTLLATVFAVLFGVTLLGDTLTPRMLIGGVLTLVGVLVIVLRQN